MLAMQVNHSSLLPSFARPTSSLGRFLLARSLASPSRPENRFPPFVPFSFSLFLHLPCCLPPLTLEPSFHSVHSLLHRDGRREGARRALHTRQLFRLPLDRRCNITVLSLSLSLTTARFIARPSARPSVVHAQSNFQGARRGTRENDAPRRNATEIQGKRTV